MNLSDFDYELPEELIAQKPASPRDFSRLMILNKEDNGINHCRFFDLPKFLKNGDVLVFNDSRVFPARLFGQKETGGLAEILLLHPESEEEFNWADKWRVLSKPGLKIGQKVFFGKRFFMETIEVDDRERVVRFNKKGEDLEKLVYRFGRSPLPPYISSADFSRSDLRKNIRQFTLKKPVRPPRRRLVFILPLVCLAD